MRTAIYLASKRKLRSCIFIKSYTVEAGCRVWGVGCRDFFQYLYLLFAVKNPQKEQKKEFFLNYL